MVSHVLAFANVVRMISRSCASYNSRSLLGSHTRLYQASCRFTRNIIMTVSRSCNLADPGDIHQAARILFNHCLDQMTDEEIGKMADSQASNLPDNLTTLGGIALHKYQSLSPR